MNWLRVLRSGVRPSHADDFAELKARLRPLCKRTLRRQVREHVKYPNRHALVQEFVPSPDEQRLYDLVSEYLQRPNLYALPASQRQLVTLSSCASSWRRRRMSFRGRRRDWRLVLKPRRPLPRRRPRGRTTSRPTGKTVDKVPPWFTGRRRVDRHIDAAVEATGIAEVGVVIDQAVDWCRYGCLCPPHSFEMTSHAGSSWCQQGRMRAQVQRRKE